MPAIRKHILMQSIGGGNGGGVAGMFGLTFGSLLSWLPDCLVGWAFGWAFVFAVVCVCAWVSCVCVYGVTVFKLVRTRPGATWGFGASAQLRKL